MSEPTLDRVAQLAAALDDDGFSLSPADLQQVAASAPAPLIDTLLPSQAVVTLAGPPGIGKSFVTLSWAASVATGQPWHGLAVAGSQPVAYVLGEGWSQFGRRVAAWEQVHGPMSPLLRFIDGSRHGVDLCDPEVTSWLIGKLAAFRPALVVLDTFSMLAHVQSENDNAQVAGVFRSVRRIVSQTGATVVVVHHMAKESGKVRGATAFRGNSDTVVVAAPSRVEGDSTFVLSTHASDDGKQRDGEPVALTGFEIVSPGIVARSTAVSARQLIGDQMAAIMQKPIPAPTTQ